MVPTFLEVCPRSKPPVHSGVTDLCVLPRDGGQLERCVHIQLEWGRLDRRARGAPSSIPSRLPARPRRPFHLGTLRIRQVDDDSFAGDILSRMLKAQGADAELCMTSSEAKTRLDEAEFARKRVHLVSALVSPATAHLSASLRRAGLSRSSSSAQALIDWELEGEATGLSVLHHIMEVRRRRYPLLGAPPPRRRRRSRLPRLARRAVPEVDGRDVEGGHLDAGAHRARAAAVPRLAHRHPRAAGPGVPSASSTVSENTFL